jgi:hypothetical protein
VTISDLASTGDEPVVDIVSVILSGGEGAVDATTITIRLVEVDRGWLAYLPDGSTEFIRSTREDRIALGSATETYRFTDDVAEALHKAGLRSLDPVALQRIAKRFGIGFDLTVVTIETLVVLESDGPGAAADTAGRGATELAATTVATTTFRATILPWCKSLADPRASAICTAAGYVGAAIVGTQAGAAIWDSLTAEPRCRSVTVPPTCYNAEVPEA